MKQTSLAILLILFSALGLLVLNSAYVIDETEQVVVTQFGQPVGNPIREPGLHWKTPFIQDVRKFDKRILNWDGYPSEVPTLDKKFIWVDVTGRWRIENPLLFLQTMHNERNAQSRLDDIMDGITRNHISRYNLVDIVRSTNDILDLGPQNEDALGEIDLEKVEIGRYKITREIIEAARKVVKEYGVELVDLRIKRIMYVDTVQKRVFERMISERNRAAEQMRSEGQGVRAEVEGQREKELKRINSEAYKLAQTIKGEADAKATAIYGEAYGLDPEFYAFMSTLEKYPAALKGGRLVMTTESDFLKYLKKAE